ncbi:MAG: hypothetical protein ACFFB0_01395 [Promethearchaeota archaeon]
MICIGIDLLAYLYILWRIYNFIRGGNFLEFITNVLEFREWIGSLIIALVLGAILAFFIFSLVRMRNDLGPGSICVIIVIFLFGFAITTGFTVMIGTAGFGLPMEVLLPIILIIGIHLSMGALLIIAAFNL